MSNLRLCKRFGYTKYLLVLSCLWLILYQSPTINKKCKHTHTHLAHTPPNQTVLFLLELKSCFNTHPFIFLGSTFGTMSLKTDSGSAGWTGSVLFLFIGLRNQPFHPQQARAGLPRPHSPRVRCLQPAVPGDDRGNEALEEFHVCTVTLSIQAPVRVHSDGPATHHHLWEIKPSVTGQTTAECLHPGKTTVCQTLTSLQVPLCLVSLN